MANTMKALQTVTVGAGGASSITFSSIPQTYTDLVVKVSPRNTGSGAGDSSFLIEFNGSSSSYTGKTLYSNGSSVSSFNETTPSIYGNVVSSWTANAFGNNEIYIPNYTSSNYKSFSADGVGENNATRADASLGALLWSNTAAITSITVKSYASFNFAQYTTATLYGVFNQDVVAAPAAPTIGTPAQNAAGSSAAVAFTGVSGAASYTATSTPGSYTGTGSASPVVVSGLTDGTAYTFTVKANNPIGSSGNSSASGSVTSTTFAAYWAGGDTSGKQSAIQQFKFFAETRSNIAASLSSATVMMQGLANSGVNGYFAGGDTASASVATVQKLNFGTLTLSTTTSLPAIRTNSMNGYSNSGTAGYIPSGAVTGGSSTSIAKIAYSNDATSTISATFATTTTRGSGCANSPTAGYTFGGIETSPVSSIKKMTFSGETISTLGATLPVAIYTSVAASNNGTAGYVFGGYNAGTMYTTIKKLTYSGETVSTLSSNMSSQDFGADAQVGSWSGNAGYVGMGYNWVGSSGNQIGKLPYSTETWSVTAATMANTWLLDAGSCSNSGVL